MFFEAHLDNHLKSNTDGLTLTYTQKEVRLIEVPKLGKVEVTIIGIGDSAGLKKLYVSNSFLLVTEFLRIANPNMARGADIVIGENPDPTNPNFYFNLQQCLNNADYAYAKCSYGLGYIPAAIGCRIQWVARKIMCYLGFAIDFIMHQIDGL